MARALDDFPEGLKLLIFNLSVIVDIHAVKELHGAHLAESTLPVFDSLVLVNGVGLVDVENRENLLNFLQNCWRKFLNKLNHVIRNTLHFFYLCASQESSQIHVQDAKLYIKPSSLFKTAELQTPNWQHTVFIYRRFKNKCPYLSLDFVCGILVSHLILVF